MSNHLNAIMGQHNRVANLQVVFIDVEKYSQRRTLTQIQVVDRLTEAMRNALGYISKEYIEYAQSNSLNFQEDIIRLPTGDGAAIVFTFDGLHDVHLKFSLELIKLIHESNEDNRCERFNEDGWCNCHSNFNITIGISEGRGIIYKDLNDRFNVAGGVVNMAARAMSMADRNQVIFTEEAYRQIIDMVDDPHLVEHFIEFQNMRIKHGNTLTVYQYVDNNLGFLNNAAPDHAMQLRAIENAMGKMSALGIGPTFNMSSTKEMDPTQFVSQIEKFADLMSQMRQLKLGGSDANNSD